MNDQILQSSNIPAIRLGLKNLLSIYELKDSIIENLIKVSERFPQEFDDTIFKKVETLFGLTSDEFSQQRSQKHLTRIISSLFLIQKSLRKLVTFCGEKRHLKFRLLQTKLQFPFGSKAVLSFVGGICLFDRQDIFEEEHLLLAAQKWMPDLQMVKDTSLLWRDSRDSIQLVYVEFEKKEGGSFTCEEIALLRQGLQTDLQVHIKKNIPALFMIRNEEEVLKNILRLSKELDFSHEIPEMIIDFEQLTFSTLSFTIILVRLLKKDSKTITEILRTLPKTYRFMLDRNQIIGYLNNYPKEATVFRLEIPLEKSLMRADFSINFYLARQKVKSLILKSIGPMRDFNGGVILKQEELFSQFKKSFPEIAKQDPLLMENFFYSLSPFEKQITLPLHLLSTLFTLFLDATKEHTSSEELLTLKMREKNKNVFAVLTSEDFSLFKRLEETLGLLHLKENFVSFKLNFKNSLVIGFIQYKEKCSEQVLDIASWLDKEIKKWNRERQNAQVAKLAIRYVPTSFDPRVGGDEDSRVLLKMLFEGLMRIGKDGKPSCALAESVTISPDKKTYTFHLRSSYWSDGSPLIAYDFEYAWKKILSPEFNTQFASFFSPVKNSRLVKEGTIPLDALGVKAISEHSLQVILEYPTSYFLELVTLPLFSPVSHKVDQIHPNWAFQEAEAYLCNGPFSLKRRNLNYGFEFIKNPNYWDAQSVVLNQIFVRKIKDSSVYELFGKGSIDWIGRLLPYWDPAFAKCYSKKLSSYSSHKVSWCVFNTKRSPFDNQKIRKALSYCIDKEELISHLNYEDALPATSPLPLNHAKQASMKREKFNPEYAKQMFNEGLTEIGINRADFPLITLFSPAFILHEQTARYIQHQWEKVLGISCRLSFMEWAELFPKICGGHYDMCLVTWTSLVDDPFYTLNAFKHSYDGINHSKWENHIYQHLLDQASQEEDPSQYFDAAEKILIDEMPVNPLFYEKNQCISQDYFHVPCDCIYGYPDFKWAYVDNTKEKR